VRVLYIGRPGDPANGKIGAVMPRSRFPKPRHCLVRWDSGEYSSVPWERLRPLGQPFRVRDWA